MLIPNSSFRLSLLAASLALLAPALPVRAQTVTIAVDASQTVRTVDERLFGVNAVMWDRRDPQGDSTQTIALMQQAGIRCLRIPGGSQSDQYVWSQDKSYDTATGLLPDWTWFTTWPQFVQIIQALNCQTFVTVNYGSGTAQLAADWVRDANITRRLGLRYWEVGNENYGNWEYDTHAVRNDPYTYAVAAREYITAMKAVDPTIKIGVVVVTGEDTYGNATHTVTNPRTHTAHTGWTPVMLATLSSLGVTPDFAIYHRYEQTPGQETDAGLLQDAATWPADIADLRQQLNDYLGATTAANVEIVITENNSVFSDPGKQSTSLVNGLFLADSICTVMQTEAKAFMWWAFRNGTPTTAGGALLGNFSAALYGWRTYGDYGMVSMPNNFGATSYYDPHPTYYAMKLLSRFARGGDTVVRATSSSALLSAYAVRRADGTLAMLVINKSPTATQTANISVAGITVPTPAAAAYSYGIPQDNAARSGTGSRDLASSSVANVGASFSASFAPYSATVLSFVSGVPAITTQPASQSVATGTNISFSVAATGTAPLTYQWYKDNAAINGATGTSLNLSNVQTGDAGSYTVTVSNSITSATSSAATLTVNLPPTTTIPPSSGGGGGGGGALSTWFYAALALLAAARMRARR